MKLPRDWFHTSPHGTARERFARVGRMLIGKTPGGASIGPGPSAAQQGDDMRQFFRNVAAGAHAHDLGDESLYLAEELAELQWSLGGRQKRALALLVLASMISVRQGSSRLPLSRAESSYLGELIASLIRAGKLELDAKTLLEDIDKLTRAVTLDHIIGRKGEYRPLILDDDCIYQHRMLWCEEQLAQRLGGRLGAELARGPDLERGIEQSERLSAPDGIDSALAEILARPAVVGGQPLHLSAEQQYAVRRALAQRLTVISGGPGTGKTAIVVTMLRVLRRLGEPIEAIALAAPTGKAANRMWSSIRRGLEAVQDRDAIDEGLLGPIGSAGRSRGANRGPASAPGGVEPRTLHRLLGYVPGADRFRHHENNPLSATTVIVDEASMIDLVLMERLLRSLRPNARLVLLGDADQLPSVDAGAVLRDLVAASEIRRSHGSSARFTVRLTHSYRMDAKNPDGRAILIAAKAVNDGDSEALFGPQPTEQSEGGAADHDADHDREDGNGPPGTESSSASSAAAPAVSSGQGIIPARQSPAKLSFRGVELLPTGDELTAVHGFVDTWYKKRIQGQKDFARLATKTFCYVRGEWPKSEERDLAALFAVYEATRLLTVTRRQSTGSEAMNRRLHRRVLADASVDKSPELYPGEPVMMRRNDYERGLFNGDQGLVVRVSENGGPQHYRVVFPRGGSYALFHLEALRSQIELAFAMTVHKSQGSEFDEIALILPLAEIPLLTREMLYTGITRARRSVVLVGSHELARAAIDQPGQRFSGLAGKLASGPGARDDAVAGSKAS